MVAVVMMVSVDGGDCDLVVVMMVNVGGDFEWW